MAFIPKATLLCGVHFLRVCFDAHFADLRNRDLDDDVLDMIPTAVEQFETTPMRLQKWGSAQLDLSDMRCLFDKMLHKYPILVRHLGDAGAIVANSEFEIACFHDILKMFSTCE